MTDRQKAAQKIADNPGNYQVCHGCGSIVSSATVVCPNCHGYRLDGNPELVRRTARKLGENEQTTVAPEDLLS